MNTKHTKPPTPTVSLGFEVYLDREQSADLGVDYFDEGRLWIEADDLLASRRTSYDKEHTDNLTPLGAQVILLTRWVTDAPGWWHVSQEVSK